MAQGLFNSSIGRKFAMALSAIFLLGFLVMHLLINLLSLFSPDAFNDASHFMGTNPIVQFALQPILLIAVIFHFTMGLILEIKNRKARGKVKYAVSNASKNSTWMSRNMIWSGFAIELFLIIHLAGFWWHEISVKYLFPNKEAIENSERYHHELVEHFQNPIIVVIYIAGVILLSLHLMHGFQSAFQSMGANHRKYTPAIKLFGKVYSILIPLGFIIIAVYHFFNLYQFFNQ